jgi:hypothetical protein
MLERKIGAINRAVAVKVAEHLMKKHKSEADSNKCENDNSTMSFPPQLPIVIDEHALDDILGVCNESSWL